MTADVKIDRAPPTTMEGPCVVVCDRKPERFADVARIVCECGAAVLRCERPQDAGGALRRATSRTAVLGAFSLGSGACPELDSIRLFKSSGFAVICCQDGVSRLPLGLQCLAFLAGCSHLLDSEQLDFAELLRDTLKRRLLEVAADASEERTLRSAMAAQGIVGESGAIFGVFRLIMRIATLSNFPVLITGESGTGKELLANAIHRLDPLRRHGPFVPVNCSAVAHELAESEFFGHRRGAFTGADRDRRGLFRSANGGVLFLDEIAELDERLQAKLLRVLQEQRVLGLGEDLETRVNVRVIAATNADLQDRVRQKRFRPDLFNRLNALAVHVPPLRERSDDIRPLAEHFLESLHGLREHGPLRASDEFTHALTRLELTGNARQLENLIRWVVLNKADDHPLSLRDLPRAVWEQLSHEGETQRGAELDDVAEPAASRAPEAGTLLPDASVLRVLQANRWSMTRSIADCERLILRAALEHESGNQSRAARLLGITARSVYNKLRKHSLHLGSPTHHAR